MHAQIFAFVAVALIKVCFAEERHDGGSFNNWGAALPNISETFILITTGMNGERIRSQDCAVSVTIEAVEQLSIVSWGIPHNKIIQDGVRCTSDGMMITLNQSMILERSGASAKLLHEQPLLPLANALDGAGIPFLLGVEQTDRMCGKTMTSAFSVLVFFYVPAETTIVNEPTEADGSEFIGELRPDTKYMIVYGGGGNFCKYVGILNSRSISTLSPDVEPTMEMAEESADSSAQVSPGFQTPLAASPMTVPSPIMTTVEASASPSPSLQSSEQSEINSDANGGEENHHEGTAEVEDVGEETVEASEEMSEGPGLLGQPACFPGDSLVSLANGKMVRMDKLKTGVMVSSGTEMVSTVHGFSHRDLEKEFEFIEARTSDGGTLTATSGHYIFKWRKETTLSNIPFDKVELVAMRTVKVGDELLRGDGGRSEVILIKIVKKRGLINPHTLDGGIVVNGFVTSCFTADVRVSTALALLSPLRAAFRMAGVHVNVVEHGISKSMLEWIGFLRGGMNALSPTDWD